MTEKRKKALEILQNSDGMTAKDFARKWFGDEHDIWKRVSNQGNGACSGKGAWLWAGSYLAKLEKDRIVRRKSYTEINLFVITAKGGDLLNNQPSES